MNRSVVLALLLVGAAFAGCVGGSDGSGDEAATASESSTQSQTSNGTAEAGGHNHSATLQEPPEWKPGQFWTVEITPGATGETIEITRVVTSTEGSAYRVGMPAESFSHPALLAHFPGLGEINKQTLGFSVHGEEFQPLDFPLTEGKTWTTTLYQSEFEAEVVSVSGTTAEIGMVSTGQNLAGEETVTGRVNLTYDASVQAITEFEGPLGAQLSVTSHDHGYEGSVLVPFDRAQFIEGRVVGAFDLAFQPAPPSGAVEIGQKYDQASFAQLVGSVDTTSPADPGVYREVTTDPGGNTTETQIVQTAGGFQTVFGSSTAPSGEWTFEHVAGGVGVAATEIIAYQTETVQLSPDTNTTASTTR